MVQLMQRGNPVFEPLPLQARPRITMDEIDYYGTGESQNGADDTADEEFLWEGSLALERSPEELAQAILDVLHRLVETYGIEDAELENLVELLKETFTIVEYVPRLKDRCSALEQDKGILHDQWAKEKEKYRQRTEERTAHELNLEAANKELKETVQQLKMEKVDSESRLETVKKLYDEHRVAVETDAKKQQDEYSKLWGIIQVYQEKYEQIGTVKRQKSTIAKLKKGHKYLSRKMKQGLSDEKSQESEGPTTPMSTPVDTPTAEFPLAFQLVLRRNANGDRSVEEELRVEEKGSVEKKSMESSTELASVEVIPVPSKPSRGVRKVKVEEGDMIKSDECNLDSDINEEQLSVGSHSEGEMDESQWSSGGAQVAPESLGVNQEKLGATLADELAADPNYLANTEMARLLTDLQKIQLEKEDVVREKQSFLQEIEALKKVNASLEDNVHLLSEKEDRLKEELARAKNSSTNIVVADDISELGELSYCCTKEELFSKLRELMEYKACCIELKEEVNRLRRDRPVLADQEESSSKKSSGWLRSLFKWTPRKKPAAESPRPVRASPIVNVGQQDYDKWLKKSSINVANFISITGWLLGPSATKMLRLLPSVIGKISLGIYEVERVDCAAIAMISVENAGPQKPVRQKKDLVPTTGWTQGGIRDKYRSHAVPCMVELWVASKARQETKVEVVSVFARAGQHVMHHFNVNLDHIQCMRAIPGRVPLDMTASYSKTATLPEAEPPLEETTTMWLVSQHGMIHFHEVGPVPFQKRNMVQLDNSLGAFCIQYVDEMVLVGQQQSHIAVFRKGEDGLWNINDLQYIKLPEVIGAQDVRSILPLGEELWVGAGHWIVVLEKGSLVEKGNIHVKPTVIETRFKAGDMVVVGNTIVVAQHRGSHLVLCCADTADVIGSIDVTDLCGIYQKDKVNLKEVVVVSSLCADSNCIYVGTKSGTVVCFSVATLREFLEGRNAPRKEGDVASPRDNTALVEPVAPKSIITDTVEARCSGVSLNGHVKAAKTLLHALLPVGKKQDDAKSTLLMENSPSPSNPLMTKPKKPTPKQFCELIISVGIGHVDFSSVGQGLFNVVASRHQASKTELLVWGQPEK